MRITPVDIRQQQFSVRMFRGYDVHEVDAFLEDVAEDYEQITKENALLKEQLATLEERMRGFEERDRTLQDALIAAQRVSDEMKEAAKREAQLVLRDAELEREKLLEAARTEEAKLRSEALTLQRTRRHLFEGLRATVEMYQRLIAKELADEGPAAG
ncbi:MAG: DivIVA domain-containing protein [Candidatus Rokubacteria bacterium]|nr:DivIVA domain-containing protein [Candidatus Rokubacteria bacterium]